MDYAVRRPLLGGEPVVAFNCPGCRQELESPLTDAGNTYPCPFCQRLILTPGANELAEHRRKQESEVQAQAAERRAEAQEATLKALAKLHKESEPPETVWTGTMYCRHCGYQWESRRNTPPARCHACGARHPTAVRTPVPKYAALLVILALLGLVVFCMVAVMNGRR